MHQSMPQRAANWTGIDVAHPAHSARSVRVSTWNMEFHGTDQRLRYVLFDVAHQLSVAVAEEAFVRVKRRLNGGEGLRWWPAKGVRLVARLCDIEHVGVVKGPVGPETAKGASSKCGER